MTNPNWTKPSQFFRDNKLTFKVGDVIDPAAIGMPAHPTFGPLPIMTVTKIKAEGDATSGLPLEGVVNCAEAGCTEDSGEGPGKVLVHLGDWFQVRRCRTHQKRLQRRNQRQKVSPEVKAEREAQRAKEKAERDAEKAAKALEKQTKRLEEEKKRLEDKLAKQKKEADDRIAKAQAAIDAQAQKAQTSEKVIAA